MSTYSTNSYNGRYLELSLVQKNSDPNKRTVNIDWTITVKGGSVNYYSIGAGYFRIITPNNGTITLSSWGKSTYPNVQKYPVGPKNTYVNGTVTLKTDTNGELSFSVEWYHDSHPFTSSSGVTTYWTAGSGSSIFTINPIPVIIGKPSININNFIKTQANINNNNGNAKLSFSVSPGDNAEINNYTIKLNNTIKTQDDEELFIEDNNLYNNELYYYSGNISNKVDGIIKNTVVLENTSFYLNPIAPIITKNNQTITRNGINFSLTCSLDHNRILDKYYIQYGTTTDYGLITTGTSLLNLEPNRKYYYKIYAVDKNNGGPYSTELTSNIITGEFTTLYNNPVINSFEIENKTSNSVTLKWNATSDLNAPQIYYNIIGIQDNITDNTYTIENLDENTLYSFSLRAYNDISHSSEIETIEIITKPTEPRVSNITFELEENGSNKFKKIIVDPIITTATVVYEFFIDDEEEPSKTSTNINYQKYLIDTDIPGGTTHTFYVRIKVTGEDEITYTSDKVGATTFVEFAQKTGWFKDPETHHYELGLIYVKVNGHWERAKELYKKKNGSWH